MKQTTKRAIKTISTILLFFIIFITNTHIINASEYAKYNKRNDIENYVVKENDTLENIAFMTIKQIKKFVIDHNVNEKFYIDDLSNL